MKEKVHTIPNLLKDAPLHQAALAEGKNHFGSWTHNVADRFKSMEVSDIKEELRKTALPFAVCFEHVINDFNMATAIRNANAFNAREIFYIGNKKWDRRGAVGVHNYHDVKWVSTLDDLIKLNDRYTFVGVDNVPGSVSISSYSFQENTMLFFGEEGVGLTPKLQSLCKDIIHIDMYGSVRSLNCGTASGIAMFAAASQYRKA